MTSTSSLVFYAQSTGAVISGWSANREKEVKKKYKLWSLFGILNLKQVQIKILKNENFKKVYSKPADRLFCASPFQKMWMERERKMSGKDCLKFNRLGILYITIWKQEGETF